MAHDIPGAEKALTDVTAQLAGTPYEVLSLRALSGGTANFIFHGILKTPLPDGTKEVVVKHGEGFVASNPDFAISTARCEIEVGILQHLETLSPSQSGDWTVRTPKAIHFDPVLYNQVQEYKPAAMSLKDYALKHFASSSPALETCCVGLGVALGKWLRTFHDRVNDEKRNTLRELAEKNKQLQGIKQYINYSGLSGRIESFPSILEESRALLEEVGQITAQEIADNSKLSIVHGDFWTGNVLLSEESSTTEALQKEVFVVDWEMLQLGVLPVDIGQMVAELYELKLFKDIDAGLWIIRGFCSGYGTVDRDFGFRALVHVGAHLLCFGTTISGWGTPEQVEGVAREGRDILTAAWKKDEAFFKDHNLSCLLGS